jgi:hypothetical protein
MVFHVKERTQIEGAEKNIQTKGGGIKRGLEKTA